MNQLTSIDEVVEEFERVSIDAHNNSRGIEYMNEWLPLVVENANIVVATSEGSLAKQKNKPTL